MRPKRFRSGDFAPLVDQGDEFAASMRPKRFRSGDLLKWLWNDYGGAGFNEAEAFPLRRHAHALPTAQAAIVLQ